MGMIHKTIDVGGLCFDTLERACRAEVINAAVKNCPTKAISYVPRRDLGLLEYAQMQARGLHRAYEATVARGFVNTRAPLGPFELAKEYR
eukprot:2512601-Amphidinium_carterae.2